MIPVFFGLRGTTLAHDEQDLFRACEPAGYILFRRNIETPQQVRALTDSLRAMAGNRRLPILIDQEGGRVARLGPPHWPEFPAAARFGAAYARAPLTAMAAARLNAQALALMLSDLGISVDCLPVLDVGDAETSEVIGDRSFGADPLMVAALGRAVLDGLRAGGVAAVVKHIPGHGRATLDSHHHLPVVAASADELERDLLPFRRLGDAPMAMTAHILYSAWDSGHPASTSATVIEDIIRGRCRFGQLLMSDDIGMAALGAALGAAPGAEAGGQTTGTGTMGSRARAVLDAGCDIALHCSGDFAEMEDVAKSVGPIGPLARQRLEAAMAWPERPEGTLAELAGRRDALLDSA